LIGSETSEACHQKDAPCCCVLLEAFSFVKTQIGNKVSKCFIEPQVIPPLHGNEISKPLVRYFVQESVVHTLFLRAGKEFVSLHIPIIINHQADVLHRSSAIVWHPNLIELLERIRSRKGLLVKLYSTFGNPEVLFFLLFSIFGN